MFQSKRWSTISIPEVKALPKAVYLRAQTLGSREMFPSHSHPWNQFVYSTSGTLVVTVEDSWYVITPEQAIWVPTGVEHTTGALNGAEFRNLYVADTPDLQMPAVCNVFSVNDFLRSLIIELEDASTTNENSDTYIDKLNDLILFQLKRLPATNFHLPWPKTPTLQSICEELYKKPADSRSAEQWGRQVGMSVRTMTRRFEKEVGISPRKWRYRMRLFLALEWMCAGRGITDIALDLGYESTSSFSYMFRKEMGCSPTEWCKR